MKYLFVPYEIALALKEKGFDEPCLAFWNHVKGCQLSTITNTNSSWKDDAGLFMSAPLYQQAIDWFREKHNIDISICIRGDSSYQAHIFKNKQYAIRDDQDIIIDAEYKKDAYYTCLEKAIEEALKLIWPWPST